MTFSFSSASLDLKVPNDDHDEKNENAWRVTEVGRRTRTFTCASTATVIGANPKKHLHWECGQKHEGHKELIMVKRTKHVMTSLRGNKDHQTTPSTENPCAIAHVRYIEILTWIRSFLVIFLHLVWFTLSSSFLGNCETTESWKICNFYPKASESCWDFNISNVGYLLWRVDDWAVEAKPMHLSHV